MSFPELVAHIPITLVSSDFDPADPPSSLQTAHELLLTQTHRRSELQTAATGHGRS